MKLLVKPVDNDLFEYCTPCDCRFQIPCVPAIFNLQSSISPSRPAAGLDRHQSVDAMAQEISDIRPAMISAHVAASLDEYRRFRHLVRNIYATNLVPSKMQGLLERLLPLWEMLRAELIAFAAFLEQIAPESL